MTCQLPISQGRGHDRLSRLFSNQSRRISQRRPFFGFESSVSSSLLTDDDPVVTCTIYCMQ